MGASAPAEPGADGNINIVAQQRKALRDIGVGSPSPVTVSPGYSGDI